MSGERSEGEEGSEQNGVGKGPLENHLRDLIEEVQKNKVKGALYLTKRFHLLEEEDNDIDEDQAAQAQAEDLQIFPDDISMKDTVTFKHLLQKALSTFCWMKIEPFIQPDQWFKRRFIGRLDEEIDAETTEKKIGCPTCQEGGNVFLIARISEAVREI